MDDRFLDPTADIIRCLSGKLPHWCQLEKTTFITFRLADSLPQSKLDEIKWQQRNYMRKYADDWSKEAQNEYHRIFTRKREEWLDHGYGECVLAKREVRRLLEDEFAAGDGDKYLLGPYVIMPNHVHCLITPLGENEIEPILKVIKGRTGYSINRLLGRHGRLWQKEPWDRIVRSELHLRHCIAYIRDNPRHLPPGSFTLYIPE